MRRKLILIVITLSLSAAFFMGLISADNVIAHRALEQGDYMGALEIYLRSEDYSGVGMVYCAMKQYDEAIKNFEIADDFSGIGMAYCGKRKFDEAIKYFEKANDYSGLGLTYCGKREFKTAREYFMRANDRSGLGLVALGEKDYDGARRWFKKARDKNGLGLVLLAENRFDEALSYFKKLKNVSGMGMALLGKRRYDEAAAYFIQANDNSGLSLAYSGKKEFDKAISFAQKANDLSALGHAYCGKKEFNKALDCFNRANDLSGISLVYSGKRELEKALQCAREANDLKALGLIYCGKKDFDIAISYFQKANDDSGLSLAYSGKKEFDKAISFARKANDLSALGHAYCGKNQFDTAISYFQKANDDSGLSLAYGGKKDYDKAIEYATMANDPSALGYAYCGKKDFDTAIKYFRKANDNSGLSHAYNGKNSPRQALAYAQKANDLSAAGHAYLKMHNYTRAIDNFTSANDYSGLGLVYCQQKEYEKAFVYAQKANDLSLKGNILLGLGDMKLAEDYFTRANDLSGLGFVSLEKNKHNEAMQLFQSANDSTGLGFVYSERGDYKKAEECFVEANDYAGIGRLALKRKQFSKAVEYFKKANDYDGLGDIYWQLRAFDKAIFYFKLEGSLVKVAQAIREKKDIGFEEALVYAQLIIEKDKFVYPLHIEIGKIYYEEKKYEEAIKEFKEVLESGSYYASEALMWIGKVRYYQRRYDLAEAVFKQLMSEYPHSQYRETAEKGIETIKLLKEIAKKKENDKSQRGINLTSLNRCGPDSLAMLLASYGIKTTPEEIAQLAGTDEEGTTMLGLQQAAQEKDLKLSALKLTYEELSEYKDKAILLIDGSHYMVLRGKDKNGIILTDFFSTERISYGELSKRWQGETLALRGKPEQEELAFSELVNLKGGNQRSSEGGLTKNDPGLHPSGYPLVDYGKLGTLVPIDFLTAHNLDGSFTGCNSASDGGLGRTAQGSGTSSQLDCETVVDPISITGGQVILPVEEIVIPGRGRKHNMSLSFERTYSSRSEVDGPLGFGWSLYYGVTLEALDSEEVIVTLPDGTKFSYLDSGTGFYYGPECDGSILGKDENEDYVWTRWTHKYGRQFYHFNQGKLSYIKDRNNNHLAYEYDPLGRLSKVHDDTGRYLEFQYNLANKISQVNAIAGSFTVTYNYFYDVYNNLRKVTGPENYECIYEYNDLFDIHNITASIDSNGNRTSYIYSPDDCCIITADAESNIARFDYNFEFGVTVVRDARNRPAAYEYERSKITRIVDSNGLGSTVYTYDDKYIRNSTTDIHGNRTQWVNEKNYGNCLKYIDAELHTAAMAFHPRFHYVTEIVDYKGREWNYVYDTNNGNLLERITPAPHGGGTSHIYHEYDPYGNRTKITDPEGIVTNYQYDTYGNTTKVTDGEGNYIYQTYDDLSRLTSSRYGTDNPTTYEYDNRSRLKKKISPDSSYEEYIYDDNSNLLSFRDANGRITTYTYNKLNQAISRTDAEANLTEFEYDVTGNLTKIIRTVDTRELITRIEYDDHYMRKTKVIDPEGEITEYTYEDSPPVLHSTDFTTMKKYKSDGTLLTQQARVYDESYRLKEIKDGLTNATTFTYDGVGNLISVTDPNNKTTTYEYDPDCNLRIKETNPLAKSTTYTYYNNGRLKTKTDANNNTITYKYDLAGKLKKTTYPDITSVEYEYNQYGKVGRMTDIHGITTYAYNQRTWLKEVDGPEANDTISYTYDNVGNRDTMAAAAEGTTTYTYYNNNLLKAITNPQFQTTTFTYDEAGRTKDMAYANGTKTEWAYYDNNRIEDLTVKDASLQLISSYHYEYNTLGQIIKVTDKDGKVDSYVYDDAGRLTHEDRKDASQIILYCRDYTYDPAGNRTDEVRDGQNINYTYNAANQITSRVTPSETINYAYNNNGNLVTEISTLNGTRTYAYDYENCLTQFTSPASLVTSSYNADGKRISVNTNGDVVKYLYDGMVSIIERDASNNTLVTYTKIAGAPGGIGGLISCITPALPAAKHIPEQALLHGRGKVLDVIFDIHYYHDSHLGNVNQITDSDGAVVQTYGYDAFGNITHQAGSLTQAYAYKTKEYSPETGLVFFGARYYNPLIGRFITPDPSGMIDGPNLYLYCGNDSVNLVDPYGNVAVEIYNTLYVAYMQASYWVAEHWDILNQSYDIGSELWDRIREWMKEKRKEQEQKGPNSPPAEAPQQQPPPPQQEKPKGC